MIGAVTGPPSPPNAWSIFWPVLPLLLATICWIDSSLRRSSFSNQIVPAGVYVSSSRGSLSTLHCGHPQLIVPLSWTRADGQFRRTDDPIDIINSQNGIFVLNRYGTPARQWIVTADRGVYKNGMWAQRFEVRSVSYSTIWCLALVPAVVGTWRGALRVRWRRRRRQHVCPACGYDWRVTPGKCPECGYGQSSADNPASTTS
jgi:hypothetical protein